MKLQHIITWLFVWIITPLQAQSYSPNMPWVDISGQKERQIIISQGTVDLYNGHPTTLLLADNKTIYCVWSRNHGGPTGFLAKSEDGGLNWQQLQIPEDWKKAANCPSLYRMTDPAGKERIFVFTASPNMGQSYSEDGGKTWSAVRSLNKPCVMAFCSVIRLKNNSYLGLYHRGKNDEDRPPLTLWQSISHDGGVTWEESTPAGQIEGRYPCEPCVFRSPDNNHLICIARDNSRKGNALMMFSSDEGKSWTNLQETPWGLTGDRHIIKYLPDGRLIAVFRDMAINSPTRGHFVAWVGTYDDLINGTSGQYRIKLLHSYAGWDCGYPGLEILPDGTIVATTYIKIKPGKEKQSIVEVRFKIEETDAML